jgi:hypothetical protein
MAGIKVVATLVCCAADLVICDDIDTDHLGFADAEDCRNALPALIGEFQRAGAPDEVVMGRCPFVAGRAPAATPGPANRVSPGTGLAVAGTNGSTEPAAPQYRSRGESSVEKFFTFSSEGVHVRKLMMARPSFTAHTTGHTVKLLRSLGAIPARWQSVRTKKGACLLAIQYSSDSHRHHQRHCRPRGLRPCSTACPIGNHATRFFRRYLPAR